MVSHEDQAMIDRAAVLAMTGHGPQVRKYTGEPYWHHCEAVAETIERIGGTAEMIAAAWMHDLLEDTMTTESQVLHVSNAETLRLVIELTNITIPADGNRAHRSRIERDRLAKVSAPAQTIKLADLINNTISIVANDPGFAKVYLREKEALLRVLGNGDERLMREAEDAVQRGWATLGNRS